MNTILRKKMIKILILNDTSKSPNIGCQFNMYGIHKILKNELKSLDFEIESNYLDKSLKISKSKLLKFDLCIVNGEGSIKNSKGINLLEMTEKIGKLGIPTHFINFTGHFEKKDHIKNFVQKTRFCQTVSAREPLTYFSLKNVMNLKLFPDMGTNIDSQTPISFLRNGIMLGCGAAINIGFKKDRKKFESKTKKNYKLLLETLANTGIPTNLVIINSNKNGKFLIKEFLNMPNINVVEFPTFSEYRYMCENSKLNITGRHHGVVMSYKASCPFMSLSSNSYKTHGDQILYGNSDDEIFEFEDIGSIYKRLVETAEIKIDNREKLSINLKQRKEIVSKYHSGHISNIFKDQECMSKEDFIDWDKIKFYHKSWMS